MRGSDAAVVCVLFLAGVMALAGGDATEDEEARERSGRIIAMQSIKTILTTTTSTTTAIATCVTLVKTDPCKRRRKRSNRILSPALLEDYSDSTAIDSSLSSDSALVEDGSTDPKERMLAYTVWWTTTSTYILYSTTAATTMSISYLCSIAGAAYPPAC